MGTSRLVILTILMSISCITFTAVNAQSTNACIDWTGVSSTVLSLSGDVLHANTPTGCIVLDGATDVVLDGNGHTISSTTNNAYAISMMNAHNVTIKNVVIAGGFVIGINIMDSFDLTVIDSTFANMGTDVLYALNVEVCDTALVQNNTFTGFKVDKVIISTDSPNLSIINNTFSNIDARSYVFSHKESASANMLVEGNEITDAIVLCTDSYVIFDTNTDEDIFRGNTISNVVASCDTADISLMRTRSDNVHFLSNVVKDFVNMKSVAGIVISTAGDVFIDSNDISLTSNNIFNPFIIYNSAPAISRNTIKAIFARFKSGIIFDLYAIKPVIYGNILYPVDLDDVSYFVFRFGTPNECEFGVQLPTSFCYPSANFACCYSCRYMERCYANFTTSTYEVGTCADYLSPCDNAYATGSFSIDQFPIVADSTSDNVVPIQIHGLSEGYAFPNISFYSDGQQIAPSNFLFDYQRGYYMLGIEVAEGDVEFREITFSLNGTYDPLTPTTRLLVSSEQLTLKAVNRKDSVAFVWSEFDEEPYHVQYYKINVFDTDDSAKAKFSDTTTNNFAVFTDPVPNTNYEAYVFAVTPYGMTLQTRITFKFVPGPSEMDIGTSDDEIAYDVAFSPTNNLFHVVSVSQAQDANPKFLVWQLDVASNGYTLWQEYPIAEAIAFDSFVLRATFVSDTLYIVYYDWTAAGNPVVTPVGYVLQCTDTGCFKLELEFYPNQAFGHLGELWIVGKDQYVRCDISGDITPNGATTTFKWGSSSSIQYAFSLSGIAYFVGSVKDDAAYNFVALISDPDEPPRVSVFNFVGEYLDAVVTNNENLVLLNKDSNDVYAYKIFVQSDTVGENVGCFSVDSAPTPTVDTITLPFTNFESCLSACDTYLYAGVYNGEICWCVGDADRPTTRALETECTEWCVGRNTTRCGGDHRVSLYDTLNHSQDYLKQRYTDLTVSHALAIPVTGDIIVLSYYNYHVSYHGYAFMDLAVETVFPVAGPSDYGFYGIAVDPDSLTMVFAGAIYDEAPYLPYYGKTDAYVAVVDYAAFVAQIGLSLELTYSYDDFSVVSFDWETPTRTPNYVTYLLQRQKKQTTMFGDSVDFDDDAVEVEVEWEDMDNTDISGTQAFDYTFRLALSTLGLTFYSEPVLVYRKIVLSSSELTSAVLHYDHASGSDDLIVAYNTNNEGVNVLFVGADGNQDKTVYDVGSNIYITDCLLATSGYLYVVGTFIDAQPLLFIVCPNGTTLNITITHIEYVISAIVEGNNGEIWIGGLSSLSWPMIVHLDKEGNELGNVQLVSTDNVPIYDAVSLVYLQANNALFVADSHILFAVQDPSLFFFPYPFFQGDGTHATRLVFDQLSNFLLAEKSDQSTFKSWRVQVAGGIVENEYAFDNNDGSEPPVMAHSLSIDAGYWHAYGDSNTVLEYLPGYIDAPMKAFTSRNGQLFTKTMPGEYIPMRMDISSDLSMAYIGSHDSGVLIITKEQVRENVFYVSEQTTSSVSLAWRPPFGVPNKYNTTYVVDMKTDSGDWNTVYSGTDLIVNVDSLRMLNTYTFRLNASFADTFLVYTELSANTIAPTSGDQHQYVSGIPFNSDEYPERVYSLVDINAGRIHTISGVPGYTVNVYATDLGVNTLWNYTFTFEFQLTRAFYNGYAMAARATDGSLNFVGSAWDSTIAVWCKADSNGISCKQISSSQYSSNWFEDIVALPTGELAILGGTTGAFEGHMKTGAGPDTDCFIAFVDNNDDISYLQWGIADNNIPVAMEHNPYNDVIYVYSTIGLGRGTIHTIDLSSKQVVDEREYDDASSFGGMKVNMYDNTLTILNIDKREFSKFKIDLSNGELGMLERSQTDATALLAVSPWGLVYGGHAEYTTTGNVISESPVAYFGIEGTSYIRQFGSSNQSFPLAYAFDPSTYNQVFVYMDHNAEYSVQVVHTEAFFTGEPIGLQVESFHDLAVLIISRPATWFPYFTTMAFEIIATPTDGTGPVTTTAYSSQDTFSFLFEGLNSTTYELEVRMSPYTGFAFTTFNTGSDLTVPEKVSASMHNITVKIDTVHDRPYRIQMSTDSSFNTGNEVNTDVVDSEYTFLFLDPATTYYFRAFVIYDDITIFLAETDIATWRGTEAELTPTPPILTGRSQQMIEVKYHATYAGLYYVLVDSVVVDTHDSFSGNEDVTVAVTELTSSTTFNFSVSFNSYEGYFVSTAIEFATIDLPVLSLDSYTVDTITIAISDSIKETATVTYTLQISEDGSQYTDVKTVTDNSPVLIDGLVEGLLYYFRLTMNDQQSNEYYAAVLTFAIPKPTSTTVSTTTTTAAANGPATFTTGAATSSQESTSTGGASTATSGDQASSTSGTAGSTTSATTSNAQSTSSPATTGTTTGSNAVLLILQLTVKVHGDPDKFNAAAYLASLTQSLPSNVLLNVTLVFDSKRSVHAERAAAQDFKLVSLITYQETNISDSLIQSRSQTLHTAGNSSATAQDYTVLSTEVKVISPVQSTTSTTAQSSTTQDDQLVSTGKKKSDHDRRVRLGVGIGVGLGVPLVAGAIVAVVLLKRRRTDANQGIGMEYVTSRSRLNN